MRVLAATLTGAILFLAGCSEAPKPAAKKKEEKEPPKPLTGKNAFYKMYVAARSWAPDAQILKINSIQLEELKAEPGKAAAWQVILGSPTKLKKKAYTWSAVESAGNLHEGVFAGLEEDWDGRGKPIRIEALKTDTNDAYKIAAEKSADYIKKNPGHPVNFQFEKTDKHPNPSWRVFWGDSVGTAGQSVFVDATMGTDQETRH